MSTSSSNTDTPGVSLNWQALHERLKKLDQLLAGSELPPPEQKKILKTRAAALAQTESHAETDEGGIEIVAFQLNSEHYGFESKYLREVAPLKELTALPSVPPTVAGLINHRGQILTVLDLRALFALERLLPEASQLVLIMQAPGKEFGILVQGVTGLQRVPGGQLQPPPPTLTGAQAELLQGLTPGRLALLDARKLLASDKLGAGL